MTTSNNSSGNEQEQNNDQTTTQVTGQSPDAPRIEKQEEEKAEEAEIPAKKESPFAASELDTVN